MKIGIITYYDVPNYGSAFLAYAMQQILKNEGYMPLFLKYSRQRNTPLRPRNALCRILKSFSPNAVRAARYEVKKERRLQQFRDDSLSVGDYFDVPQGLDATIVGSDQIFDCKYEFNAFQYAIGSPCKQIISYAPSFGEFSHSDLLTFPQKEELRSALNCFSAHSARDDNTVKLINELTGKEPMRVLDPVLLYGFEEEKGYWNEPYIDEPYAAVYTWGGSTTTDRFRKNVCAFARNNKLKTVSIGDHRPWCDYNYADASPAAFFSLIKNSSMVITNMFHGTCFSILNEKPFYSLLMPHNINKLGDLLQHFNLNHQGLFSPEDLSDKEIPQWNTLRVKAQIEKERISSREFLVNALKDKTES